MTRPTRSMKATWPVALVSVLLASMPVLAQHPAPQPRPGPSTHTTVGDTTYVVTPEGHFPTQDPFRVPPGSNFLLTDYRNMLDGNGVEMPNTLPSDPANPYNLHDAPVITSEIDSTSPTQVLRTALETVLQQARDHTVDHDAIQLATDILEGNPLPGYLWSGFPLLHYNGPEKVRQVDPVTRNVDIHQVWYDSHIESDTAFIDASTVLGVPWTITYTVDCLNRCHDDFSPFVMYFDDPSLSSQPPPMPHVGMDQTFFPMEDGTRNVFKIKMAPGKYYNLTYTWGWRVHPPRVQVSENANKMYPLGDPAEPPRTLVQWEIDTFGPAPTSSETAKLAAIARIGELSPAKQMWIALREARGADDDESPDEGDDSDEGRDSGDAHRVVKLIERALIAFDDWFDRTELPTGAKHLEDRDANMTLLYVNNTLYGKIKGGGWDTWFDWSVRPQLFKVTLYNGDHFRHDYMNVDFGGSRGWENQFVPTIPLDGTGCKFSFGRVHWWVNAGGPRNPITVPPADPSGLKPGMHKVELTLNFEPSRRLRLYQFDPLHHDVAVYSIH